MPRLFERDTKCGLEGSAVLGLYDEAVKGSANGGYADGEKQGLKDTAAPH